ncbi:MAG: UDP-N-acetylmuramate--L-alanine ligase [Chloroflexi bacterium]|nr:UDP-N-acetylmuramate--L-alanine ligase [Chloroflexota bacterium]
MLNELPRHIHIVGIGGIGLSAIAYVLLARGVHVSGSDVYASAITDELTKRGAKIFVGHRAENIGDAELVLITSAARENNPEIVAARARGIRVDKRYDFFPTLTAGKKTIAIAGTHGKTTTTAMIAMILLNAGRDPTAVIGGMIPELNGNARAGLGEYFVIEADEYERAFLGLAPHIAVVTSIEMDHPDIYNNLDDLTRTFREFAERVPRAGALIAYGDSENVARALSGLISLRYGFSDANDWRATDIARNGMGGNDFTVWRAAMRVGDFSLQVPGKHNILNALAAIAVADELQIETNTTRATLENFRGAARRFQVVAEIGGVTIVDDYAHLPTEIRATLSAARERYPNRRIWAIFQPHTFSRTKILLDEFARAFDDADRVMICDIYAARETDDGTVNSNMIVTRMKHGDARWIAQVDDAARVISQDLKPGDVIITLGAGDVNRVGELIRSTLDPRGFENA